MSEIELKNVKHEALRSESEGITDGLRIDSKDSMPNLDGNVPDTPNNRDVRAPIIIDGNEKHNVEMFKLMIYIFPIIIVVSFFIILIVLLLSDPSGDPWNGCYWGGCDGFRIERWFYDDETNVVCGSINAVDISCYDNIGSNIISLDYCQNYCKRCADIFNGLNGIYYSNSTRNNDMCYCQPYTWYFERNGLNSSCYMKNYSYYRYIYEESFVIAGRPYILNNITCKSIDKNEYNDWSGYNESSVNTIEYNDELINIVIDEYKTQGINEYLSIASFNKFSLELMSINAPSILIELANKASLDELKHAKYAFEIANHFSGNNDVLYVPNGIYSHNITIESNIDIIGTHTINEGCFDETISVFIMYNKYNNIHGNGYIFDRMKQIFNDIINDEINHASLAWTTLYWIINNNHNDSNYKVIRTQYWNELINKKLQNINIHNIIKSDEETSMFGVMNSHELNIIRFNTINTIIPTLIDHLFDMKKELNLLDAYNQFVTIIKKHTNNTDSISFKPT